MSYFSEDNLNYQFVAKTFLGLENILADELITLGAHNVEATQRAVSFEGDISILYRANLWCRTALKILMNIDTFHINNAEDLYQGISRINWENYFSPEQTFMIEAVNKSRIFNHSNFVSLKAKDAIVDQFRNSHGTRPSVNRNSADIRIHIFVYNNECHVSLDSSGESLHRRGYRTEANRAPLNEVLAAGLIKLAGWNADTDFFDPMCGSGTLPIEAAMMAGNFAPGINRSFAFMHWSDFSRKEWNSIREEAVNKKKGINVKIFGSDISRNSIELAQNNMERAGFKEGIILSKNDFFESAPAIEKGLVLINPPYGERLEEEDINDFYYQIGKKLKSAYTGLTVAILSGNKEAMKKIGLKPDQKIAINNGDIECNFNRYKLY